MLRELENYPEFNFGWWHLNYIKYTGEDVLMVGKERKLHDLLLNRLVKEYKKKGHVQQLEDNGMYGPRLEKKLNM